ncbi:MAG: CCA tRNA nucleotidyltransferase [Alphaproteobacteria bacterium]|nr:CCA tRNA nucleotidyltransferase [Alphaproteobacteria bacterium]
MKSIQNNLNKLLTPDIYFLFTIFDNQLRLVGGCVRDFLQHKSIHDYDLATPLLPEQIIKVLEKNNIRYYTAGLKHGTITAVINKKNYEITTLRTDVQTDGRHANVAFITDYRQDATRRDFTINALYMDNNGNLSDFFNGLTDLKNKQVKFIGMPEKRIEEDFLRILRYFRFIAYMGAKKPDKSALTACHKLKSGLKKISIERIRDEFLKILTAPFASETLFLMQKQAVLDEILPAYNLGLFHKFIHIYPRASALERLAILINGTIMPDWKWSRIQKKELQLLLSDIQIPHSQKQAQYLLWKTGRKNFLFHLYKNRILKPFSLKKFNQLLCLKKPVFPVSGVDLYQKGFNGKEIQQKLCLAEKLWVQKNFPSKKSLVIKYVLEYNKK